MKGECFAGGLMKALFVKYSPDWLFTAVYNLFFSRKRQIEIKKVKEGWLIRGDEVELLSPTAKFTSFGLKLFEDKVERFFKIRKGDVVLDVGACLGDTTVPMAIKAGSTGKVIAVEPNPLNIKYLKLNLARFDSTEIVEKGIWKNRGIVQFHLHNTPTGHSIIPHRVRKGRSKISVDTLDNLFGDRRIDFAKIDVQGAEVQVLEGGDKFLQTTPKLVVETHDRYKTRLRTYPKVIEILKQHGYKTRFTIDNGIVYAWR